jgi:aryl-alcohol dehydrogenase-like predicted oxidoreductase
VRGDVRCVWFQREREDSVPIEDQLQALGQLVRQGKVRYIGLSNESPYGVMKFLETARKLGLPEVVSVQNCYNLLFRNEMDMGLSEVCSPRHEDLGILCYSPLAGGALSGKYMFKGRAPNSRLNRFPGYMARYRSLQSQECIFEYKTIAERYGFSMVQLALGWCYSQPFATSTIVGATSVEQLRENIDALNTPMHAAVRHDLSEVFVKYRDPSRMFVKVLDKGDF